MMLYYCFQLCCDFLERQRPARAVHGRIIFMPWQVIYVF